MFMNNIIIFIATLYWWQDVFITFGQINEYHTNEYWPSPVLQKIMIVATSWAGDLMA